VPEAHIRDIGFETLLEEIIKNADLQVVCKTKGSGKVRLTLKDGEED